MTFRKILFWGHLTGGTIAGVIILLMSVTGVLLMYERQMTAWADREYRSTAGIPGAARLSVQDLLENVRRNERALPASLTLHSDPNAAAEAAFGRERVVYVDVYSGAVLGEGSRTIRSFFRAITDWHRWLGMQGESRPFGRAITGASNLVFLLLVLTGSYLWIPKKWLWQHIRAVLLFRGGLRGKARDFNWHNVIGVWSAVPLFFIVLGGAVISYPWATNLIYRLAGSEPPAPSAAAPPRPAGNTANAAPPQNLSLAGLDEAWRRAEAQDANWRSITMRLPNSDAAPLTFSIDQAHRGRPDKRAQLTVNRQTSEVMKLETFASYSLGRQIRTWLRWIHTGEAGGVIGQTIAGVVSAGAAVLVWTGISLSFRRFLSWRRRNTGGSKFEQDIAA